MCWLIVYTNSETERIATMKVELNPDKNYTQLVKDKLKQNDGYCPCRINKIPDTKCMCKEFREQLERGELGQCHCGLYIITEDD